MNSCQEYALRFPTFCRFTDRDDMMIASKPDWDECFRAHITIKRHCETRDRNEDPEGLKKNQMWRAFCKRKGNHTETDGFDNPNGHGYRPKNNKHVQKAET